MKSAHEIRDVLYGVRSKKNQKKLKKSMSKLKN